MGSSFTRFIGVDLGGGKGKKTALAVLDKSRGGVVVTSLVPKPKDRPLYDAALVATILRVADGAVVCVDAPLTLPPCLRCTEPVCPGQDACIDAEVVSMRELAALDRVPEDRDHRRGKPLFTPYTERATDLYLRRRGLAARESLGQGMGPLAARAAHLARALGRQFRLNDNLIEVFPRATLELLGYRDPYKKRVDRRIDILASLRDLSFGPGVWREQCRQSDHVFDAVLCAYTGYLRSRDAWAAPDLACDGGEPRGWIWTPPKPDSTSGAGQREPDDHQAVDQAERLRLR
jgi:predicted nuclease with RNAse H fold